MTCKTPTAGNGTLPAREPSLTGYHLSHRIVRAVPKLSCKGWIMAQYGRFRLLQ